MSLFLRCHYHSRSRLLVWTIVLNTRTDALLPMALLGSFVHNRLVRRSWSTWTCRATTATRAFPVPCCRCVRPGITKQCVVRHTWYICKVSLNYERAKGMCITVELCMRRAHVQLRGHFFVSWCSLLGLAFPDGICRCTQPYDRNSQRLASTSCVPPRNIPGKAEAALFVHSTVWAFVYATHFVIFRVGLQLVMHNHRGVPSVCPWQNNNNVTRKFYRPAQASISLIVRA